MHIREKIVRIVKDPGRHDCSQRGKYMIAILMSLPSPLRSTIVVDSAPRQSLLNFGFNKDL
jgi:hypothetical protein